MIRPAWVVMCPRCGRVAECATRERAEATWERHLLAKHDGGEPDPRAELLDDVTVWLASGEGLVGAARRAGIQVKSLERKLRRHGLMGELERLKRRDEA